MFKFPRSLPRALCALTLALSTLATPALAARADANPWDAPAQSKEFFDPTALPSVSAPPAFRDPTTEPISSAPPAFWDPTTEPTSSAPPSTWDPTAQPDSAGQSEQSTASETPEQPPEQTQPQIPQASPTIKEQYMQYVPKFMDKGYSAQEVETLYASMSLSRLYPLLWLDYTPLAAQFPAQSGFQEQLLERYARYSLDCPELTAAQVVARVNAGLDRSFYTCITMVDDQTALDVLVNKYNRLSADYVPELVPIGQSYANYSGFMHPVAYQAFKAMVDAAAADGLTLYAVSAYRSYSYQSSLYYRYVAQDGRSVADTYSARPGHSEHQTGLAVDINVASSSAHFESTPHYQWLVEHCWDYGFILRYPQGTRDVTGFKFEPWHYRYVGVELAQAVRDSGLTYDEYVASRPIQDCADPAPVRQ